MMTSAIYLVAAIRGEEWIPVDREPDPSAESGGTVIPEPRNPPPRRPQIQQAGDCNQL